MEKEAPWFLDRKFKLNVNKFWKDWKKKSLRERVEIQDLAIIFFTKFFLLWIVFQLVVNNLWFVALPLLLLGFFCDRIK